MPRWPVQCSALLCLCPLRPGCGWPRRWIAANRAEAKAIICAALAGAMLAVELISLTGTIRYNRDRWQYEERLLI